jgi:putative ABC transport system permease protein
MSLDTWQTYRYGSENTPDLYSGVVVKGEINNLPSNLLEYTTEDYISTLPGYTAQVLTFSVMIIFLIIITAFVLGIFIYVLTIQKTSMFGVMKAQGISNGYIGASVIVQTFLLVAFGIIIGLVLTTLSGIFLADIIPLAVNAIFYLVITVAFFLFALFGGLFSVNAVLKIDPLKAIGG